MRKDKQTDRQTDGQTDKHPQPCTHFTPVDEALFALFSQNGGVLKHLELRFCLEIRCLNYMIFVIGILTYVAKTASKRGASKKIDDEIRKK